MTLFSLLKTLNAYKFIYIVSQSCWFLSNFLNSCFLCYRNQNVFQIQWRLLFPAFIIVYSVYSIHPNAEEIPDHICHFASAIYCNNSFRCNNIKIGSEMEMEDHRDNYIQTYISYLNSLRANYNLYSKGLLYLSHHNLFELLLNFCS